MTDPNPVPIVRGHKGFTRLGQMFLLFAILFSVMAGSATAQLTSTPASEEALASPEADDPYGRETPEGSITGFIDALAADNLERASVYLDLRNHREAARPKLGQALAVQLRTLLDRGGSIMPRTSLSNAASGTLDDGLKPELERVGTLRNSDRELSLVLEKVEGESGSIWLISAATLSALRNLITADQTLLDRWLPQPLLDTKIEGAPLGHWFALVALAVGAYFFARLLLELALRVDAWWCRRRKRETRSFLSTLSAPLSLWVTALVVTTLAPRIGVSIVARETLGWIIDLVGLAAIAWLAWRIVDLVGGIAIRRLQGHRSEQIISIATFVRRLVKAVVVAVGIMAILDTMGYDITAGLAALGVGGIALALGAQKTIENLVGGVSVIADQPVRIGDYCKVGDTSGTIEELGIRSTKIRTPADTIVVIPNSDFAAGKIENFSRRRKILLHHTMNLHFQTPPDKVRHVLDGIRALLAEHPSVRDDPPRVRLLAGGNDRLPIEVFGYVHTPNYDDFLAVQEELTLAILELVAAQGIVLAAPATAVDTVETISKKVRSGADRTSTAPEPWRWQAEVPG